MRIETITDIDGLVTQLCVGIWITIGKGFFESWQT